MGLKLRGGDDVAVAKFEVLNEQAGPIEGLVAADASKLLIDLVGLSLLALAFPMGVAYVPARCGA